MSETWTVVAIVGAASIATKGLGPVALGGRSLPPRLTGVVELLAPALLAALVATQVLGKGERILIDARLLGLAAAGVALWRRAPVLLVLVVAAGVTALARAWM